MTESTRKGRAGAIAVERARWRGAALLAAFALGAVALEGRILYLQLVKKEFLTEQADDRQIRVVKIPAHRGSLFDRYGEPLAVSTPMESITANPQELKDALDRLPELAKVLGQEDDALARKVTSNLDREFLYLDRQLPPAKAEQVRRLGLPGIGTIREYKRYYPAGEVTGHVLGFTDVDDVGREGLEAALNLRLKGENGSKRIQQDRLRRAIKDVELIKPMQPGRDLRLSIDLRLQYLAYRELLVAVNESRAKSGSVVILDPATGEVLAMVNQPSYNPNNRAEYVADHYRNRAVTDIFEPGSSFKPFVMSAALESGKYGPHTIVDTNPGALMIGNRKITSDHSNLGRVELTTVLAQSSNVGAARVALTMDAEDIWRQLTAFGIGRVTGSGLPGESPGILHDAKHWGTIQQATVSYGYGVSVTALQLARSYAAIAAGGVLRPVSMLALDEPPPGERVVSAQTAHALIGMLEAVVLPSGTGHRAAVHNYRIAGKTGTARKAAAGGYDEDNHAAIFAGIAPASRPRLVVVVTIEEPQGATYYGGDLAAPVFANIVSGALRVLAVPPDALREAPLTIVAQAGAAP
ncbi:MAG TPA: penicillin-binding transpeptidase domain-containing protein [Gammaproteobacteria bacterium]|nr:penicillin-binding transpeptidase domain-containing protein [Gammaproteobacteria bacterium]